MFSKDFEVDFIATDYKGLLLEHKFFYYAQETSIADTNSRTRDVSFFHEKGLGWVFFNYSAKIHKLPKTYDKVTCTTAPIEFKGYFGDRGFVCKNEKGEVLFEAVLKLGLMDLVNKTLIKPDVEILDEYKPTMDKLDVSIKKSPKITEDFKVVKENDVEIYRHNTDLNGHTNNLTYIECAWDNIPTDVYNDYCVTDAFVSFRKESFCGDILNVITHYNDSEKEIISKFHKEDELIAEVYFKLEK
ncbi:MAG: acyl-ACP thioesterase domain-containing protein [Lachnospirales bacterium]